DRRSDRTVEYLYFADLRYSGQGYELTVPVPPPPLERRQVVALVDLFAQEHERNYGHRALDEPVDLVNLRLVARVVEERAERWAIDHRRRVETEGFWRSAYFGPALGLRETPVLTRSALAQARPGPLIVEEYDSTTVVPPGCAAVVDPLGNL